MTVLVADDGQRRPDSEQQEPPRDHLEEHGPDELAVRDVQQETLRRLHRVGGPVVAATGRPGEQVGP